MNKAITVTCLDTHKKLSADVNETFFNTVMNAPVGDQQAWEAYLEVHHAIMESCHAQGVTFWEARIDGEYWSSEM